MIKRFLTSVSKIAVWALYGLVVLVLIIGLFAITTIDTTPLADSPAIQKTYAKLNEQEMNQSAGDEMLKVGWCAVNITPDEPVHLAGYGPRGPYNSVMDSLYARILVLENGETRAVIISVDLLMFPRILKERLEQELGKLGYAPDQIYLTATHTHHGFGNWDKSIAGQFAFGSFEDLVMQMLVSRILSGIHEARENRDVTAIGFQKIDAHELVRNRLMPLQGAEDPFLRIIHFHQQNGRKGMLVSFSGHATNLDADVWNLSRDYPGVLVDQLESNENVDFAMFCAGMVGSHNIDMDMEKGSERIMQVGKQLADKILAQSDQITVENFNSLGSVDVEIGLRTSQLRITKHLRLRDWVFNVFFGPLQANIKMIRAGNVILVGMPCDYSGELAINHDLDAYAAQYGLDLFVTSFNGNYVGYITEDQHYYTCQHDELRTMNWVGPYMGNYFTDAIKKIIVASVD